ncbi:myo-inositol-1(or 4)-monophosphatase [Diaminobutyricimonas aerilata]|uniref:Inositol-1-monophosphatase n=1 Tax=Diaminobutyricimonas aerilata TaxID=1162967 RepID=A0A2M9CGG5_9MICO|nr:inositol monophosphatase family protein [Diaminobutyricimonas aerilata]PJJ70942.1 myo-inositol-1(or 4)-monophosphatase [Diaminobutyricimonas aerilata]
MSAELLEIARAIAIQAGELAARRRAEGVSVAATKSSSVDIVTEADRETENLIRSLIAEARPDDGFLGEEGGGEGGGSGLTWVVDPIDGTVNFLYGIPHYGISIAVVEGDPDPLTWRALAGCVVNPAAGETFTAAAGAGARLNGRQIRVNDAVSLSQALVATGFSYTAERRVEQATAVTNLIGRVRDVRRMGTASLDLCFVGCGRLDAYFERNLNPWDHAAGALVAAEAGAFVGGWNGSPAGREFILAGHPELIRELEPALVESGA